MLFLLISVNPVLLPCFCFGEFFLVLVFEWLWVCYFNWLYTMGGFACWGFCVFVGWLGFFCVGFLGDHLDGFLF